MKPLINIINTDNEPDIITKIIDMKKPQTPRVGRPPEWRTQRKQLTMLLPVNVHEKVKQYAKKISEPYKIKTNA